MASSSLDVYPHPTAIKPEAITLNAGLVKTGVDNQAHGKVFFIVRAGKPGPSNDKTTDRRVLLRGVTVTMTPRPGNVPKQAVPSKDGFLPDGTYPSYEKLQVGFKVQDKDKDAFAGIETKLKADLFERRESVWPSNWERIASPAHVDAKMTASGSFINVKNGEGFIYPDIVGWTDKVKSTRVRPSPRGGLFVAGCEFDARRVGEQPAKSKFSDKDAFATNFRLNMPGDKWTDAVPLTADGSIGTDSSPILTDGVPVMRYVSPGDLTDGSVCDIVVDCVGVNRTDAGQINFIKTLTIVRFDRAPPTSRTSYAAEIAAAAEEDPSRASAVDVLNFFKAQRAAAAAAATTKKVVVSPVYEVSEGAGDIDDADDAELAEMAAKAEVALAAAAAAAGSKRARESTEPKAAPASAQAPAPVKKPRTKKAAPPPPPPPAESEEEPEEADPEAPLAASQ
jgi:hypothetical protein